MKNKKLLIYGFGGHARSVGDIALAVGYEELLFVDVNAQPNEHFLGYPVEKDIPSRCFLEKWDFFSGSADSFLREQQIAFATDKKFHIPTLIAPTANISHGAQIAIGVLIGHQAHIGPLVKIGKGSIINSGAIVDHEGIVGSYCHVSINSAMAGRSVLGDYSFLGAGAVIIDKVRVASHSIIGAGASVINDIQLGGTYVGTPAKQIR